MKRSFTLSSVPDILYRRSKSAAPGGLPRHPFYLGYCHPPPKKKEQNKTKNKIKNKNKTLQKRGQNTAKKSKTKEKAYNSNEQKTKKTSLYTILETHSHVGLGPFQW